MTCPSNDWNEWNKWNDDIISDWKYAEALYHFVEECCFDDFCEKSIKHDLSIAEYVSKYKKQQFRQYCLDKGYAV